MPRSLNKVHKKITRKKGTANNLHEKSRDAQKLRRASMREDKLNRVLSGRAKLNKPFFLRVAYFRALAKQQNGPLDKDCIHNHCQRYVDRDNEELAQLRQERRTGRPTTTREDLLSQRIAVEEKEYDNGFYIPNMEDQGNLETLKNWNGEWTSLSTLKFVRIARDGVTREALFPPKGIA